MRSSMRDCPSSRRGPPALSPSVPSASPHGVVQSRRLMSGRALRSRVLGPQTFVGGRRVGQSHSSSGLRAAGERSSATLDCADRRRRTSGSPRTHSSRLGRADDCNGKPSVKQMESPSRLRIDQRTLQGRFPLWRSTTVFEALSARQLGSLAGACEKGPGRTVTTWPDAGSISWLERLASERCTRPSAGGKFGLVRDDYPANRRMRD